MGIDILDDGTPHIYCDECGEDYGDLFRYEDADYCTSCLLEKLQYDGVIKKIDPEGVDAYGG